MSRSRTYYDLLDAFQDGGCPVCGLALAVVRGYLESVSYEFVNDPGLRDQTRAAHGFCNEHAYQWLKLAHVLGTALIYQDVIADVSEELQKLQFRKPTLLAGITARLSQRRERAENGDGHPAALAPRGRCPACRMLANAERGAIATLLAGMHEPVFHDAYAASAGLCLPHLRGALAGAPDEVSFHAVRDIAVAGQERLLRQLTEIVRKHDYRYRQEPSGEERGATERAVRQIAGAQGIG